MHDCLSYHGTFLDDVWVFINESLYSNDQYHCLFSIDGIMIMFLFKKNRFMRTFDLIICCDGALTFYIIIDFQF